MFNVSLTVYFLVYLIVLCQLQKLD